MLEQRVTGQRNLLKAEKLVVIADPQSMIRAGTQALSPAGAKIVSALQEAIVVAREGSSISTKSTPATGRITITTFGSLSAIRIGRRGGWTPPNT